MAETCKNCGEPIVCGRFEPLEYAEQAAHGRHPRVLLVRSGGWLLHGCFITDADPFVLTLVAV